MAGALLVIVTVVAGLFWWNNRQLGTVWADARIGECVEQPEQLRVLARAGTGAPLPTVACDDPEARYVVNAEILDPTRTFADVTCPNGDKDVSAPGLIRITVRDGLRLGLDSSYGWGAMCLAPVLHVGKCYSPDRGLTLSSRMCDGASTGWEVTRKLDGVSDITACSPATGLVLRKPAVTYCEISAPPTPQEVRLDVPPGDPPPAG